jgi:hypothetical protein
VLFPVAVTGGQDSLAVFLRFGFGHAVTVILASGFSFFAVFAIIGLLMALLPYAAFRRASVYARFLMALLFLALLATGFAVPSLLAQLTHYGKNAVLALPPVWFVGICETLWGNGSNPVYAGMARIAWSAMGITFLVAVASYALSFRRSFARIPETAAVSPVPRSQFRLFPRALFDRVFLRDPGECACFHFITRTLLRSESHLQIVSAFTAMGVVLSVQSVASYLAAVSHAAARAAVLPGVTVSHPLSDDFLGIPFLLAFCIIAGIRFAFEIPSELRANWVFALWIDRDTLQTRAVARKILLTFSLTAIVPLCLVATWILFGPGIAILHTAIFAAATVALVELALLRFRKIPFTCAYPTFQSHTAVTFVAYLFGCLFFTIYLPEIELWSLGDPWRALVFPPLIAIALFSVYAYRKQMLDMDKRLIFEQSSS